MKNIILIAPPQAGKGTIAELLNKKYALAHISTGDILRDVASGNDEIGVYVQETMSQGAFIKDEIIYQLLEKRLQEPDCKNGYVLDGFPRNMEQAEKYEEILNVIHQKIGIVIVIDVDKELLRRRVTGRRICKECDAIFNINFEEKMPRYESVCDKCGGELYQRSDDNLEAFETRYQTYLDVTKPIIDYYTEKGIVAHIDGNNGLDEMLKSLETIITGKKVNE